MSKPTQLTEAESIEAFRRLVRQHTVNFAELAMHSANNPKVCEMCQSLCEAYDSVDNWCDLPGSIMLVVAYQPGMFAEDPFD
jgi:hypothetical protein